VGTVFSPSVSRSSASSEETMVLVFVLEYGNACNTPERELSLCRKK